MMQHFTAHKKKIAQKNMPLVLDAQAFTPKPYAPKKDSTELHAPIAIAPGRANLLYDRNEFELFPLRSSEMGTRSPMSDGGHPFNIGKMHDFRPHEFRDFHQTEFREFKMPVQQRGSFPETDMQTSYSPLESESQFAFGNRQVNTPYTRQHNLSLHNVTFNTAPHARPSHFIPDGRMMQHQPQSAYFYHPPQPSHHQQLKFHDMTPPATIDFSFAANDHMYGEPPNADDSHLNI